MSPVVPRSSKGKKFAPPKRVRHVEDQPCEARGPGALHLLTNGGGGGTYCVGCRVPWWQLDEELNGARGESA